MQHFFPLILKETQAPDATGPELWDWVLVAGIATACIIEVLLRHDVHWPAATIGFCVMLAMMTPWRRTHPLLVAVLAFGSLCLLQVVTLILDVEFTRLNTSLFLLALPYSLVRWASGYEVLSGFAVIAVAFALAMPVQGGWIEVVGAALFLLFPAALGASVRYRESAHRRAVQQVRLLERERIARDLHDSVAHHVSAIAVQAQAGLARGKTHPNALRDALSVIEDAASRTLTEMRQTVSALRETDDEINTQVTSLKDIKRLANRTNSTLKVNVVFTGKLSNLDPALCTTLFQLTREALTNAEKHARGASTVDVHINGDDKLILLRVVDDGKFVTAAIRRDGFGLLGMKERVSLLGGTMQAGPGDAGGWTTEVTLPKRVSKA